MTLPCLNSMAISHRITKRDFESFLSSKYDVLVSKCPDRKKNGRVEEQTDSLVLKTPTEKENNQSIWIVNYDSAFTEFCIYEKRYRYTTASLYFLDSQNKLRQKCLLISKSKSYQLLIGILIIFHSGLLSSVNFRDEKQQENSTIQILFYILNFFYLKEILIKVIGQGLYQNQSSYLRFMYNIIDFICMVTFFLGLKYPEYRYYEILKLYRVTKIVRRMTGFKNLKLMMKIMKNSQLQTITIIGFLFFILAMLAILGQNLFQGLFNYRCRLTEKPENGRWEVNNDLKRLCSAYPGLGFKCPAGNYCGSDYQYKQLIDPQNFLGSFQIQQFNYGITKYDNFIDSMLTSFQMLFKSDWQDMIYLQKDIYKIDISCIYILTIIIICNYFIANMIVAQMMNHYRLLTQSRNKNQKPRKSQAIVPVSKENNRMRRSMVRMWSYVNSIVFYQFTNRTVWENFNPVKRFAYKFSLHPLTKFLIYTLIISNCIIMSLDQHPEIISNFDKKVEYINMCLHIFFVFEQSIKLYGLGTIHLKNDKFNQFDLLITIVTSFEIFTTTKSLNGLITLRALRLFRIFIQKSKKGNSISILMATFFDIIPAFLNFSILFAMNIYVFAIIGMNIFQDKLKFDANNQLDQINGVSPRRNFDSFQYSLCTVFQVIMIQKWNQLWYLCYIAVGSQAHYYFIILLMIGQYVLFQTFMAILLGIFQQNRIKQTDIKIGTKQILTKVFDRKSYIHQNNEYHIPQLSDNIKSKFKDKLGNLQARKIGIDGNNVDNNSNHNNCNSVDKKVGKGQQNSQKQKIKVVINQTNSPVNLKQSHECQTMNSRSFKFTSLNQQYSSNTLNIYQNEGLDIVNDQKKYLNNSNSNNNSVINNNQNTNINTTNNNGLQPSNQTNKGFVENSKSDSIQSLANFYIDSKQYGRLKKTMEVLNPENEKEWQLQNKITRLLGNKKQKSQQVGKKIVKNIARFKREKMVSQVKLTRFSQQSNFLDLFDGKKMGKEYKQLEGVDDKRHLQMQRLCLIEPTINQQNVYTPTIKSKQKQQMLFDFQYRLQVPKIQKFNKYDDQNANKYNQNQNQNQKQKQKQKQEHKKIELLSINKKKNLLQNPMKLKQNKKKRNSGMICQEVQIDSFEIEVKSRKKYFTIVCIKLSVKRILKHMQESSLFIFHQDSKIRKLATRILGTKFWDRFTLILIFANGVNLASDNPLQPKKSDFYKYLNQTFTTIFLIEMGMKFISLGFFYNHKNHQQAYIMSSWNHLDFIVVMSSTVNQFIYKDSQKLQAFKVLRTFRALRPLKVINKNESLKIIVNTLFKIIPQLVKLILIVGLILVLLGIIMMQIFKGQFYNCYDLEGKKVYWSEQMQTMDHCIKKGYRWENAFYNYDNVFIASLSIFKIFTGGYWIELLENSVDANGIGNLQKKNNHENILFLYYIISIVGNVMIFNLMVGLVLDNFKETKDHLEGYYYLSQEQKEWADLQKFMQKRKLIRVFKQDDEFNSQRDNWFKVKTFCNKVGQHKYFEQFIILCTFINIILMGLINVEMDKRMVMNIDICNSIFLGVFHAEFVIKIIGTGMNYFYDSWNCFDFLIIILTDAFMIIFKVFYDFPGATKFPLVLRGIKFSKLLKYLRHYKNISVILNTYNMIFIQLVNMGLLFFLFIFIFGILGMNIFAAIKVEPYKDGISPENIFDFSSFRGSILVLIQCATLQRWDFYLQQIVESKPNCQTDQSLEDIKKNGINGCGSWAGFPYFIVFIIIVPLITMNLFIAVVIQGYQLSLRENEAELLPRHIDTIIEKWAEYDPDATGFISPQNFSFFIHDLPFPLGLKEESQTNDYSQINDEEVSKYKNQEYLISPNKKMYLSNRQIFEVFQIYSPKLYCNNMIHFKDVYLCISHNAICKKYRLSKLEIKEKYVLSLLNKGWYATFSSIFCNQ